MRITRHHSYRRRQSSLYQKSGIGADILYFLQRKGIDIGQLNGITLADADVLSITNDNMEKLHVDLLYTVAVAVGIPSHRKVNRFLTALAMQIDQLLTQLQQREIEASWQNAVRLL